MDERVRATMELHKNAKGVTCEGSGRRIDRSLIPSWHPMHVCGMFCDGQDGMFSRCQEAKRLGPPSAVDQLSKLVDE